jgi:uncharacterized membrane protein YfcA
MTELDLFGWVMVALCALMIGINKTGIPGFGILFVPVMAMAMPAKQSTGVTLGMLILADLFAVVYYRRRAVWIHIIRLLPATLAGIVAGYFVMGRITDEQLQPAIGAIVLAMLTIHFWREKGGQAPRPEAGLGASPQEAAVPTQWRFDFAHHRWFGAIMGFLAGFTTMLANAAGPVMIVYLLAMRLPKIEFVGTSAWFFFIVNWLKVPFSLKLGLIAPVSIKMNLLMLPLIAAGAVLGIFALKKIPQKIFEITVQVLALAAAIKLLL